MELPADAHRAPAISPPPGVMPDMQHPPSLALPMRVVIGLSTALMVLCVGLRAYSRLAVSRNWGVDDCTFESPHYPVRSLRMLKTCRERDRSRTKEPAGLIPWRAARLMRSRRGIFFALFPICAISREQL